MIPSKVNLAQMPIETPLLRLLLRYFGSLSIQLYPVSGKSIWSMLNCAWNIALISTFAYNMASRQGEYYAKKYQSANMIRAF